MTNVIVTRQSSELSDYVYIPGYEFPNKVEILQNFYGSHFRFTINDVVLEIRPSKSTNNSHFVVDKQSISLDYAPRGLRKMAIYQEMLKLRRIYRQKQVSSSFIKSTLNTVRFSLFKPERLEEILPYFVKLDNMYEEDEDEDEDSSTPEFNSDENDEFIDLERLRQENETLGGWLPEERSILYQLNPEENEENPLEEEDSDQLLNRLEEAIIFSLNPELVTEDTVNQINRDHSLSLGKVTAVKVEKIDKSYQDDHQYYKRLPTTSQTNAKNERKYAPYDISSFHAGLTSSSSSSSPASSIRRYRLNSAASSSASVANSQLSTSSSDDSYHTTIASSPTPNTSKSVQKSLFYAAINKDRVSPYFQINLQNQNSSTISTVLERLSQNL